ncbi:MAG: cyclic nucleotide-binding domain-containing protein [Thermodesulfobacteriota bacterium]|nr:cyclic nucleotide-binding domain-containing protein [Thermodesulfobacteriota bacterium]
MRIEEITEILRMCELFSELSDKELRSIAKLGRIEKFEAGEKIYEQSSIGTKLYILFKGHVTLERRVDLGGVREANVTVFTLRERANRRLMGGWCTLVGKQHVQMCSAVCVKPTQVISMRCSDLRETMIKDSNMRIKILEKLVLLLRDRIYSSYGAIETL